MNDTQEDKDSDDKKRVARALAMVLVSTVAEFGEDVPSGPICLGFQAEIGCSIKFYRTLEDSLVNLGVLIRCDDRLTVDPAKAGELGLLLWEPN